MKLNERIRIRKGELYVAATEQEHQRMRAVSRTHPQTRSHEADDRSSFRLRRLRRLRNQPSSIGIWCRWNWQAKIELSTAQGRHLASLCLSMAGARSRRLVSSVRHDCLPSTRPSINNESNRLLRTLQQDETDQYPRRAKRQCNSMANQPRLRTPRTGLSWSV